MKLRSLPRGLFFLYFNLYD